LLDFEAAPVIPDAENDVWVSLSPDVEAVNPTIGARTQNSDQEPEMFPCASSEASIPSVSSIQDTVIDSLSIDGEQNFTLHPRSQPSMSSTTSIQSMDIHDPNTTKLSAPSYTSRDKRPVSPETVEDHHCKRLKSDRPLNKPPNSKLPHVPPSSPKLVIGISRSATASRKLKQSMLDGSFQVNSQKQDNYEQEIRIVDREAAFQYGSTWTVYHSRCGKWFTMSEAYNTTKFKLHVKGCKASPGKTSTMTAWAKKLGWKVKDKSSTLASSIVTCDEPDTAIGVKRPRMEITEEMAVEQLKPPHYLPCPGITAKTDPRVAVYLLRTGASGGGARSVTAIAQERFGVSFKDLGHDDQELVHKLQQHEHTWRNDHVNKAVFSTKCNRRVDLEHQCCVLCLHVLNSRAFKNTLRVPLPPNSNYKFLNHQYRNESLGLIYAKSAGLQELFEDEVCCYVYRIHWTSSLTSALGC
jgi:hypothetical protein